MEELKFRVWIRDKKVMYDDMCVYPRELRITKDGAVLEMGCRKINHNLKGENTALYIDDVVIMLWTGKQDRNGRDIYEGDIVKHVKTGAKGYVVWDIEALGFYIHQSFYPQDENGNFFYFYGNYGKRNFKWEDLIIIGNIYEDFEKQDI